MFNIKAFPDFQPGPVASRADRLFLKELGAARKSLGARFVNVSLQDYSGPMVQSIHFLTYPIGWIAHYVTHFYTDSDPLLHLDWRSISSVDWAELYSGERAARIRAAFSQQGLGRQGMTICQHMHQETYCVMSASFEVADGQWTDFRNRQLDLLRFEASRLGDAYQAIYETAAKRDVKLTPRECECLYWVAMGKTDDQISEILHIGRWTVIGHLQSARNKLGCSSRASAVAQAIVAGIINIRQAV